MQSSGSSISYDRFVAAVAVILLHFAIVATLLNVVFKRDRLRPGGLETTLLLLPAAQSTRRNAQIAPRRQIQRPTSTSAMTLALPSEPNTLGLGQSLFSCLPENLLGLTAEELARCRTTHPAFRYDATAVATANLPVKERPRWERELAIKQGPLLLPCASPTASPLNIGTALCLGDMLLNGYDPDKMQHYSK